MTFQTEGRFKLGKFLIPSEVADIAGKDWDLINRHHYLLTVPAKLSASDMIEEFRKVYRKKKIVGLGVFDQFTNGLKKALNSFSGRGLFYKFERIQLRTHFSSCAYSALSEVYGPILIVRYLCTSESFYFLHLTFLL